MDEEEVESHIEDLAAQHGMDEADVRELFEEQLEKTRENSADDIEGEATLRKFAVSGLRGRLLRQDRVGPAGEVEELPILALGHGGVQTWQSGTPDEHDVVVAYGIVNPADRPAGLATFICDEAQGVDLGRIRDHFHTLETLRGWFILEESENFEDRERAYYVARSTGETRVEEVTPEEEPEGSEFRKLPDTLAGKRTMIHDHFLPTRATLDSIHEHFSRTNEDGYTADFGLDIKRFEGQVLDYYRDFENDWGTYVLLDETVIDPDDLEGTDIVGEDQRTPGLKVFLPPEHIQYGSDSRIEVLGAITRNDGGQILMNGIGTIPVVATDIEERNTNTGDSTDDGVEEEAI